MVNRIMKKIFLAIAAAAMVFVSCNKEWFSENSNSIKLNVTVAELGADETATKALIRKTGRRMTLSAFTTTPTPKRPSISPSTAASGPVLRTSHPPAKPAATSSAYITAT